MSVIREYETLYIIAPDQNEDQQKAVSDKVNETIIKAGGEIVKNDVWGRRKLAYPIKKKNEGVYVLVRSKGPSTLPQEIDIYIKRTPEILRHLTTVVTKQQYQEEARIRAQAAKREEEARVAAEEARKRAEAEEAANLAESSSENEPLPAAEESN